MALVIKRAVSKKKRRFRVDGYDLDLSYVTTRIIAMGFPSEGREGIYRNKMSDVIRFLDERHEGQYKVYNLCSERDYDASKFHGRVQRYAFDDHNPPPLAMLVDFCRDVEEWFSRGDDTVACIHCKAGKGRTGCVISAWLQYSRMWETAEDALSYYAVARTQDGQGVTIPSQQYYNHLFNVVIAEGGVRSVETVFLKRVRMFGLPSHKQLHFVVQVGPPDAKTKVFTSPTIKIKKGMPAVVDWDVNAAVAGDIKIIWYEKGSKACAVWFHASYLDNGFLRFTKTQIDTAVKDKKHKIFPPDFALELYFDVPVIPTRPSGPPLGTAVSIADVAFDDDDDADASGDDADAPAPTPSPSKNHPAETAEDATPDAASDSGSGSADSDSGSSSSSSSSSDASDASGSSS